MAQQTINNGETGLSVRTKINDNFTELYTATANPYPRVVNFAALPTASTVTGQIYVVENSTGIWPLRRSAGMWLSDGVNWAWLGNMVLVAEQITVTPSANLSDTDVQSALTGLADDLVALDVASLTSSQILARTLRC